MTPILAIYRERVFSPGREADDARILEATAEALRSMGAEVRLADVGAASGARPPLVLAMCQGLEALDFLEEWEDEGSLIINRPRGILNCYRARMVHRLAQHDVPTPVGLAVKTSEPVPQELKGLDPNQGVWVKRGDVHAMESGDVFLARSAEEIAQALHALRDREIEQAVLQQHLAGDVVKFYAVRGKRFFEWSYRSQGSGPAFPVPVLQRATEEAGKALDLEVFGGDAVITPDGQICLIDINDWPSFASCWEGASQAIAHYVRERAQERQLW